MALSADITVRLDASTLVQAVLTELAGSSGSLGGVAVPDIADGIAGIQGTLAGFDPADLNGSVARLVEQGGGALAAVVPVGGILSGIEATLEVVEIATTGDLRADLEALAAQLAAELEGSREGGAFGVLMRLSQMLAQAPQSQLLGNLAQALLGAAAAPVPGGVRDLAGFLPAVDSLARSLGGLMMLESVLSEAQRLTAVMADRLDAGAVRRDVDGLLAMLGAPLAVRIAATDPTDAAALAALADALAAGADRLAALLDTLAAGMGQGEATLAYLDVPQIQAEVASAAALLREIDLGALEKLLRGALSGLDPLRGLDFARVPAQSLDALLAVAETEVAAVAGQIGAWNPAELVQPMVDGIHALTAPLAGLTQLVGQVVGTIQGALESVKRVLVELPIDTLAGAIETLLQPVSEALALITDLVADVSAALQTAADAAIAALGEVEGVVDGFKAEIEAFFGDARAFVAALNLDQVAGQLAENIQAFTQAVGKAQMKPYFDAAVGAIGTAADTVEAVPFGLLPEDMKAEVDAVCAPIKAVDLEAVEVRIESLLGIGADGRFTPRDDLVDAFAGIQVKFDELVLVLQAHDPEQYLAQLDEQLAALAARIREIAPAVALQPVQDAIDQAKAALAGLDLRARIAPLQQVFDDAIAAMQAYSPATLLAPVQQRVDAARQKVIDTLKLDEWAPAIDRVAEQATATLALIDPAQLEGQLAQLLGQARDFAATMPDRTPGWIGTIVSGLYSGSGARVYPWTFGEVQGWVTMAGGGAAALAARTDAVAAAVQRTHAAVAGIDIGALGGEVETRLAALRSALDGLAAEVSDTLPVKTRLATLSVRLDARGAFAQIAANRTRYLARLEAALPLGETLRRTGLSEVDAVIGKLHRCFEPVLDLLGSLKAFLAAAGLGGVQEGVPQMLRSLFAVAPPERLAGLAAPLFVALRGRVQALVDAIVTPLKDAIAELQALVGTLDLAPMAQAVDEVFQAAVAEVQALSPATLLAAPLAAFDTLKAEVDAFDPLAPLVTVLDALRDTAARVLEKLSAAQLLADPVAIYREIVAAFDALDVQALMQPVLDLLDSIARQVDEGLDDTVVAFKRLQDALPAGGGGSSVSVEVVA